MVGREEERAREEERECVLAYRLRQLRGEDRPVQFIDTHLLQLH